MAAPMLSDVQVAKRTIRSKTTKKTPLYKNVLLDPHPMSWPKISKQIEDEILEKMKSVFSTLKLGRPTPVKADSINRKDRKQYKKEQKLKKKEGTKSQDETSTDRPNRFLLVMGLNNVVRCLERGELRLVAVCQNVNQSLRKMMNHLIPLCASRKCPSVCLDRLQAEIAPVLSLHSLLALGIKKCPTNESDTLDDLVNFITKRCPPLDVPCLNTSTDEILNEESILSKTTCTNNSAVAIEMGNHIVKKAVMQCGSHVGETNPSPSNVYSNQKKFSKMTDFSDLYIFKDVSQKKSSNISLDFLQFDSNDSNEGEVITFTLPKTSKTKEVNPNIARFIIPDDDDNSGLTERTIPDKHTLTVKRKLPDGRSKDKPSGWKKAKIKQKKANPNRKKKPKKQN